MISDFDKSVNEQIKLSIIERISFLQKNPLSEHNNSVCAELSKLLYNVLESESKDLLFKCPKKELFSFGYVSYLGKTISFTYDELDEFIKNKINESH